MSLALFFIPSGAKDILKTYEEIILGIIKSMREASSRKVFYKIFIVL